MRLKLGLGRVGVWFKGELGLEIGLVRNGVGVRVEES